MLIACVKWQWQQRGVLLNMARACSFISKRSNRVIASAVAPAKPQITPSLSFRTLRAFGLMTCEPRLTWPSPMRNCHGMWSS